MSDVEEPPTKMSKYEEYLEPEGEEGMEEVQEEWLSEGVLTDDDYVQTTENDQDKSGSQNTSQEEQVIETLEEPEPETMSKTIENPETKEVNVTQNIEEQLNNLESSKNGDELPEDLDAFLIRKADGKVLDSKVNEDTTASKKQAEDDGNDTDDLLRMLGDGDQKVKKKSLKVVNKSIKVDEHYSSDDDEFIYEGSKVKTLKLAKNALIKRSATKAVPEDMSDGDDESDQSSDEISTVQRMFEVKKSMPVTVKSGPPKKVVKHVVQVKTTTNSTKNQKPEPKVKSQITNQKSILKPQHKPTILQKPQAKTEVKTPTPFKPLQKPTSKDTISKSEVKEKETSKTEEFDEIIDEEEFLEDDDIDLDEEEFGEVSEDEDPKKQRIMRPEMMDEEVPSDGESHSEDGSLYDELPSSDSEDLDDWFTLDIRSERAGDYLPLLGTKARELLLAERRRVSTRVSTLRQSLSALTDSARRQADQLRAATTALAEIDDTLRAA